MRLGFVPLAGFVVILLALLIAFVFIMDNDALPTGPDINSVEVNNIDVSNSLTPVVLNIDHLSFSGNATVTALGTHIAGINITGGGSGSSIAGEEDLTPVVPTIVAINAGTGLLGVDSGSGRFTLNVITPTPQPTATAQPTATPQPGGSVALRNGMPIPDGSDSSNTAYIGVPGVVFYSGGAQFVVANDLYYEPFQIVEEVTVNRISFEVTSAGNPGDTCRVGIYETDEFAQATDLMVDAGEVVVDSTGWKHAAVADIVLSPGQYAGTFVCESGPALFSHNSATYLQGAVNSGTTSATRIVRTRRDSAPTGTPHGSGFANPGDSPWDTQDLINIGGEGHFLLFRWSVN